MSTGPRLAYVGADEQRRRDAQRERGHDPRPVLLVSRPEQVHGLAPNGRYVLVHPLTPADHEVVAILRRSGWREDGERATIEGGRFYLALHSDTPDPDATWTEVSTTEPLAFTYTPDEIRTDGSPFEMEIPGTVDLADATRFVASTSVVSRVVRYRAGDRDGITLDDVHRLSRTLMEQQRAPRGWPAPPVGPVEFHYAGPDEQDPYEHEGDLDLPTGPLTLDESPAAAHLSSDASRRAYAAAGRLRDAGDGRDDDLEWPDDWSWGRPVAGLSALDPLDEDAAHAPVYAEGTMPGVSGPVAWSALVEWAERMSLIADAATETLNGVAEAFGRIREGIAEAPRSLVVSTPSYRMDAFQRAYLAAQVDARFLGDFAGWRPIGIRAVNPPIRGASPGYVVIDEAHEWACEAPPVARVVDALRQVGPRLAAAPDAPVMDVEPVVRISAWLDVDPEVVEALRRGDSIDLSDRRPQAARFSPRLPAGSPMNPRWRP